MGQVFTTLSSVTEDIPLEELGLAGWEDLAAVEVSDDEQIGDNFVVMEDPSSRGTQIESRSALEINTEPSNSQFSRMLQHKESMLEIARLRVRVLEEQRAQHRREHTELLSFYRIATEAYNELRWQNRHLRHRILILQAREPLLQRLAMGDGT